VTIPLGVGQTLEKGRVVLATCQGGQSAVMLTLALSYVGGAGQTPATGWTGGPTVTFGTDPAAPVPYSNPGALLACHGQPGAGLFLVDRWRYFISIQNNVPWLMLDTGLDLNGDGTLPPADPNDLIPVAKNVEDMQIAYVLNPGNTSDIGANGVLSDNGGTQEEPLFTAPGPIYTTDAADPSRFTTNPANVRGLRITLAIRSDQQDVTHNASWTGDILPARENRNTLLGGGRFRRYLTSSQIMLRNLDVKGPFTF
jgi:hypothetical protein